MTITRSRIDILALVVSLAVGFAAMLHFGADANWDLQNYHLYNGFAGAEGRLGVDPFLALQAYFNPALDVPFYLAFRHFGIYAAHALLAVYLGLFIWVVFLFNRHLLRLVLPAGSLGLVTVLALAATVIGVTGASAVGQAITTFNEIQTALLVVASLALVLPDAEGGVRPAGRMALAGLIMGIAVGLKLTAMVYLVAACVALLPWRLRGDEIRALLVYGVAALAGLVLSHGAWSWALYERLGNPIFPLFNGIFRSPFEAPANFADMRFFPETTLGYLTYPLEWAFTMSTEVAEVPLRDPRFALLLVAALGLVLMRVVLGPLGRAATFVAVFAVTSYAVWLVRFSILRYAVPVEVVTGSMLVLLVAVPLRAGVLRPMAAAALASLAAIALAAYTRSPDWGRVSFAAGYAVTMPPTPDDATILLVGKPITYVVPLMATGSRRFVAANDWSSDGGPRSAAARAVLASASGQPWAVVMRGQGAEAYVDHLGWHIDEARCAPMTASLSPPGVELCPLLPNAS